MTNALRRLAVLSALALPLLAAPEARAGIEACGNIHVEAEAMCEVLVEEACIAKCEPVSFNAACAAELEASCDGMCSGSAEASCTGSCNTMCTGECQVDPGNFECEGEFPVPTGPEKATPIEHVILIVKENKTFDCVFGDLDPDEHDVDVDPSLVRWGEQITPNLHALARRYAISDSFFVEAPNSDTGHLWLTATHLTEYVERVYLENDNLSISNGYPVTPPATPDVGNFFTHLMDLDVSLRIYGEIVGMLAQSKMGKGGVFQHSDAGYPGGKAAFVARAKELAERYGDRFNPPASLLT